MQTYIHTYIHTDRQTERWMDMTKLIVTFRSFANAGNGGKVHMCISFLLCGIFCEQQAACLWQWKAFKLQRVQRAGAR
jgi:hypothetical protein